MCPRRLPDADVAVSAAKTLANALYIILALAVPQLINANAPQFQNLSYRFVDGPVFATGLLLLFGSLCFYCALQRCLGSRRLVWARCAPACYEHLGVLSGQIGDVESDMAREQGGQPCSTCCEERGKAPPREEAKAACA